MIIVAVAFYFVVGAAFAVGIYNCCRGKKKGGQENAKPVQGKPNPKVVVALIGGIALPAFLVWVGGKYGSGNAWVSPNTSTGYGSGDGYTSSSGDVHVGGYYRKDGTYVQPHWRSHPDGDPSNNWSTAGNVNPHTGEVGHRNPQVRAVPVNGSGGAGYVSSSGAPEQQPATWDEQLRIEAAARLRQYGVNVDWQQYSYLALIDAENRIQVARRLQRLGYNVDWRENSYLALVDAENRIQVAGRLWGLGISVDWRQYSYLTLVDWENRIQVSGRLRQLGYDVDWQQFSYLDLITMENRIRQGIH